MYSYTMAKLSLEEQIMLSDEEMHALVELDDTPRSDTPVYSEYAELLQLMGQDDELGIGAFFRCHGALHKDKEKPIPAKLIIMKKKHI